MTDQALKNNASMCRHDWILIVQSGIRLDSPPSPRGEADCFTVPQKTAECMQPAEGKSQKKAQLGWKHTCPFLLDRMCWSAMFRPLGRQEWRAKRGQEWSSKWSGDKQHQQHLGTLRKAHPQVPPLKNQEYWGSTVCVYKPSKWFCCSLRFEDHYSIEWFST